MDTCYMVTYLLRLQRGIKRHWDVYVIHKSTGCIGYRAFPPAFHRQYHNSNSSFLTPEVLGSASNCWYQHSAIGARTALAGPLKSKAKSDTQVIDNKCYHGLTQTISHQKGLSHTVLHTLCNLLTHTCIHTHSQAHTVLPWGGGPSTPKMSFWLPDQQSW